MIVTGQEEPTEVDGDGRALIGGRCILHTGRWGLMEHHNVLSLSLSPSLSLNAVDFVMNRPENEFGFG